MATTYNGWQVVEKSHTRVWKIPGSKTTFRLLNGPAAFVLVVFASWFNDQIERLYGGTAWDDWGWSPVRTGRGLTSGISNHCSGTAIDVNALWHTQHKSGTFSAWKRARIAAALRLYSYSLIAWGGLWRPENRDEMHFEIKPGTSKARVRVVAAHLAKTKRGRRVLFANGLTAAQMLRLPS